MRILHINGAKGWGGNEQQLIDLIYELNELKIHNILCCIEGSALEKYSIENNLDFFTIKKIKYNSFSSFNILSTNINKKSIDLIHLHTSDSILLYLLTHKIYSIEPNSIFSKKGISKSTSTLSKFKYNFSKISKIICVSNIVKENFKHVLYKKNWNKLVTVYDGINLNRLEIKLNINLKNKYVIPKTNKLIGNIANHNRAKDIETLINTANYLINELNYKNITFIQIGSFTKRTNNYKKLIKNYNLEKYFIFTNFIENSISLIPQFDLYIITSKREGGPSSLLEAMAQKVPIVSTKVGVVTEAIEHNKNGLLSNIKDYKSLASNIYKLLNNSCLQSKFKEKSYQIIQNKFTTKHLTYQTLKIYKEILNDK